MELVERYLQAVGFWLPKGQKDDILAELGDDLRARIEEREEALGRALNEQEMEGFLRENGRPVVVANRYLPQRVLIGPVWFPVYLFVLKVVGLCYLIPWIVVTLVLKVYGGPVQPGSFVGTLWTAAFSSAGVVTIVFAVLERLDARILEKWEPRQLPKLRNPMQIRRSDSAVELGVLMLMLSLWARNLGSAVLVDEGSLRIELTEAWPLFWAGFGVLLMGSCTLAVMNLARPYWSRERAALKLGLDAAGGVLWCVLMKTPILYSLAVVHTTPERAKALIGQIHYWMNISFAPAVVILVIMATINGWRLWRAWSR